jgi:hypothetical protein
MLLFDEGSMGQTSNGNTKKEGKGNQEDLGGGKKEGFEKKKIDYRQSMFD